ncbi:calcium/sodium antiporter [Thalassospira mesophila]|uniref:Conjugal transfer protein TraR n=1 Tax=Thalassospira mesophila TaxID=1293891 RepID=A0A1Y2L4I8_9PROT|nr:calcium/sodium antiporter [Thalassospira mesophila]OSQ40737.1 conjugal transfer protein TraR [Thalassospira mesophila]
MEQLIPYLQIFAGLVLLTAGGEFMVRGAVGLALLMGISKVIVGLTIVAAGTSAPEFVVSLNAALAGAGDIAMGNVVGSNIANILLILGSVALLKPVMASRTTTVRDGGAMLLGTLLFIGLCLFGVIDRWAGVLMLAVLIGIWYFTYKHDKQSPCDASVLHENEADEVGEAPTGWAKPVIATLIGVVGLTFGADLLVDGGVTVAREFGISEAVIGLTLVAFGTSLPELAASMVAAFRGHSDVALGNVFGSNLLNLLVIIGGVSVISPITVPAQIAGSDMWIMLAVTVAVLVVAFAGRRIGRVAGAIFMAAYFGYIGMLFAA